MNPDELKERIRLAEEAVAGMTDENLKRIAFETLLTHSLGGEQSSNTKKSSTRSSKKKSGAARPKSAKPTTEKKVSSIELDVEQLKSLKSYYDDHAPSGTEESVFTLAFFIHEVLKQKVFHEADVFGLYTSLMPLKPTQKPPVLTLDTVKRAMTWLVAPSRRKQWLKFVDGGYEISSHGIHHMTYKDEV